MEQSEQQYFVLFRVGQMRHCCGSGIMSGKCLPKSFSDVCTPSFSGGKRQHQGFRKRDYVIFQGELFCPGSFGVHYVAVDYCGVYQKVKQPKPPFL